MSTDQNSSTKSKRNTAVVISGLIALTIILVAVNTLAAYNQTSSTQANNQTQQVITSTRTIDDYVAAHTITLGSHDEQGQFRAFQNFIAPEGVADVEWSGNAMQVGRPGDTVTYTLSLHNNTVTTDTYDISSDTFWPLSLSGNVFTITANSDTEVLAAVNIPISVSNFETTLTVLTATSQLDSDYSVITLTTTAEYNGQYLPYITTSVPEPTLTATRPNSQNDWQLEWESIEDATGYEIQESQDPTFATIDNTFNLGAAAVSHLVNLHEPSPNNVYFYRGRAIAGSQASIWSNVVQVNAAYYDEFNDNTTGWSLRRLTNIDQTTSFYEIDTNKDWLIVQSLDSWDWAISSPLKPAPEPPYAIEYKIKHANLGNLVSHGAVFGADWNGGLCPDWSTLAGVYQHTACFNRFYFANTIWFSDIKLLFERIDQLVWCPNCGGSPMKRLGDIDSTNSQDLSNVSPNDWNTYRIEVRENSIKFFANNHLQNIIRGSQEYTDTRYINQPYFGIMATTDEYSNSTARVEYFRVTPLDN